MTFDPYLSLPLPISRPDFFQVSLVPFDIYRTMTASKDDEEEESDEDYRMDAKVRVEHPTLKIETTPGMTIYDLKKEVIEKT